MKKFIKPAVRVIKYDSESLMNPGSLNNGGGTLGGDVLEDSETPDGGFAPTRYRGVFGEEGSLF